MRNLYISGFSGAHVLKDVLRHQNLSLSKFEFYIIATRCFKTFWPNCLTEPGFLLKAEIENWIDSRSDGTYTGENMADKGDGWWKTDRMVDDLTSKRIKFSLV